MVSARETFRRGLLIRAAAAGMVLLFFGILWISDLEEAIEGYRAILVILVALIGINPLLWWLGERRGFPLSDFYLHWAVDVGAVSLIIYELGGLDIPIAAAGYMVMIVSSATFATMRTSIGIASAASAAYISVWLVGVSEAFPHQHVSFGVHLSFGGQVFLVGSAVLFFFMFALLAGTLADQLRKQAKEIEVQKQALEESYRKERDTRRGLALLSAIVQHDVYGPLGVVDGACGETDAALERQEWAEARTFVKMIKERLRSIETAVRGLGLFQEGREERAEIVSIGAVVDELVADLEGEIEQKQAVVERVGEDLETTIAGEKLYHVLRNLLTNALKAIPSEGEGRIGVECRRCDGSEEWAVIRVTDNGPGVSEGVLEIVKKGRKTSLAEGTLGGGSQAGLALARSLAEGWGGGVEYERGEGNGSIFSVTIPISRS